MSLRRWISVSSVVVVASGAALAQPKKDDKKAPAAPAGGAPAAPAEGSAVQPIEDSPPADMEGTSEDPDAPRGSEVRTDTGVTTTVETAPSGYPIELARRPITLPTGMAEVSIGPHIRVSSPFAGSDALRARYGITPQVQLGLTYVYAGIYDDPATADDKTKFHAGKAGGLDVTVLLTNWAGVRVGLPVYLDPFAMSVLIGAPLKFRLSDKLALGGMDDVVNVALPVGAEFAPSFYQELENAAAADRDASMSTQSRGTLRFSGYAQYQQAANLAIIGRLALEIEDFSVNRNNRGFGDAITSLHGGVSFSPKPFLDVGGTIGFDDLADMPDSFTLTGILAVRI